MTYPRRPGADFSAGEPDVPRWGKVLQVALVVPFLLGVVLALFRDQLVLGWLIAAGSVLASVVTSLVLRRAARRDG